MTLPLFSPGDLPEPPSPVQAAQSMAAGKPRSPRVHVRDQMEMRWDSLDDLLETDRSPTPGRSNDGNSQRG